MLSNCLLPSVWGPSRSNTLSPSLPYLPLGPSQSSCSHVGPHVVSCRQMCICTSGLCALSCLVGFSSATVWQRGPSLSVLLHSLSIQTHFCSFSVYLFVFPIRMGPLWGKGPLSCLFTSAWYAASWKDGKMIEGRRKYSQVLRWQIAHGHWKHTENIVYTDQKASEGERKEMYFLLYLCHRVYGVRDSPILVTKN